MAMENPFEGKEIWFGVGSQDLYGEEALRQVAQQTGEMVDFLNATGKIPAKIVLKPTLKSSDGVKAFMTEASANPNVIGVITWCHTFSPAKMWIRGLEVLTKPLLQLNTQHHFEIPWETIDMDFMNLNQAAHGDREFGYILTRLGINTTMVITGDISQVDLTVPRSGLATIERILGGINDIAFVHLKTEDVVRHQLVGQIVAAYDRHSAIAGDHRDIERKGRRNHTDFDARQQADSTNQSETDDER